jgi:YD repeat-containing protein
MINENRLIKIKKSNDSVTVAEFTYDDLGRKIEKKDSLYDIFRKCG